MSKLYFQEDSIQLIELNSERNNVETPLKKLKKKNKIDSPTVLSSNISVSSSLNSKISDIFIVKQSPNTSQPIPKPRKINTKQNSPLETLENVAKSSETLDTHSGDVQSIFSQKSESLSYKERLRNRFFTIKKQAETSVTKKEQKNVIDSKIEEQLNLELSKREKRKTETNFVQDSYNFFCIEHKNEDIIEENDGKNIESEDNTKQSVSDFLGISNLETDILEYIYPNVIDYSLNENTIFKINKNRPKLQDELNIEQRNLDDEGIYTENVNYISKYELKIIEDKLFDDEKNWFQNDGKLKLLPDPRLKNCFKPFETQTDFILKYSPPTLYEPAENIIQENTLEIIIHDIKFKHHHLFTKEHVLQQKLIELFDEHQKLITDNLLVLLIKKLNTFRFAKNNLGDNIKNSGDCNVLEREKYLKYLSDIADLKEKIYNLSCKERELKKCILFLWKSIKNLRKTQKNQFTNVKLIIAKETVDYNNEKQKWDNNIDLETSEYLEKMENEFQNELNSYKTKLKQWKIQQKRDNDSEISSENLEKPRKPKKKYNQQQIKSEIEKKMINSLKPPGEPNLEFSLQFPNISLENSTRLSKTKIFVKISHNNKEICKTKSVVLDETFLCNFHQQFSIKLYRFSRHLSLQICEQTGKISYKILAEIFMEIPGIYNSIFEAEKQSENFENSDIFKNNNLGIGTGVELNKIVDFSELNFVDNSKLFLSGAISFSLGWNLDKNIENIIIKDHENYQIQIPSIFDLENLEELVKTYPDPLDPKNVLFFDYINKYNRIDLDKTYFHINPHLLSLQFCDFNDLESNPRFKLLKLRFSEEPEFKNLIVPNRIKEIDENIFSDYEKRRKDEIVSQEMILKHENIDSQRIWARRYLEQAEKRIIKLTRLAERKISVKDVLVEDFTPSLRSLGVNFLNWLQPKRPLRPTRKINKNITSQISFKELNILINIIGAIQVPNRKENTLNESSLSSYDKDSSLRPFVVVNFRDKSARTTVAEGSNPIWNQELTLSVNSKNENVTLKTLQNIQENITINLYDETIDDLLIDDRFKDRNIHQILGCNWIGSFEIPFKTLLLNNRIEGTFKLNLPPFLLGYERQNIQTFHNSSEKIDTFLTIFITLQPFVQSESFSFQNDLECIETQYVEEFIENWQVDYNNNFPQRKFQSLVTTLTGERCCMTRFFKEIKLPELSFVDNIQLAEIQLAKFVSLIPFRECEHFVTDMCLNSEQILTLIMGSTKDHCILLTNYFLTIGLKSWLILGQSLIEGYSSYVLIEEKTVLSYEYFIYNVKSCKKYNIYDSNCPLNKIFCAINNENIWANIQPDDRINQTRFDFNKSSDWLPLFNNNVSPPTNLQQLNVQYFDTPSIVTLQDKIETKLRKKFMKWRKFSRTTFSHYCNSVFKKILAKLELKSMQEINFSETPEHFPEIQMLLESYQVKGFAKFFPYTNIIDLIDFLHKTGLHLNDNPNIEFSLSVFVNSYCNNTVIVWLFIASLLRKR